MRRVTDDLFNMAKITPGIVFESAEIETVTGLITAGLGVGILPRPTQTHPDGPIYVPLDPEATRVIGLAWIATGITPPAVARFLDHAQRLPSDSLR